VRFLLEYVRQPDAALEGATGALTRGQQLSLLMVVAGLVVFGLCAWRKRKLEGASTLRR
jgi:prolipoprotein diacylglyceryltransferase